jgi:hypothetical protein
MTNRSEYIPGFRIVHQNERAAAKIEHVNVWDGKHFGGAFCGTDGTVSVSD